MGEVLEYLLNSLVWSVIGLAVGYILGKLERTSREVHDMKQWCEDNYDHDCSNDDERPDDE